MEDISVLQMPVKSAYNKDQANLMNSGISIEVRKDSIDQDKLVAEVDDNFKNYLKRHSLANEEKLLVLSSRFHYYYDYEELKEVKTLINLKKLNLIKHLDDFLHTLYSGLSPKTNFIGCFSDRKTQRGVNMISRLYNKFINMLDAKFEVDIDRRDFSKLLESNGFKIIDMTEINGLIYFRTQNH